MMAQPDGEATTSVPTGRCGKHRQSSLRSLRSLREIAFSSSSIWS